MHNRIIAFIFAVAALALPALAQTAQLPTSSPIEKELAARATNVDEVTLSKNMLAFASEFMNGKDKDEAATRQLIEGLDGIYVRDYEFDKEGQFTAEQIEQLRAYYETSEWTPIVRERERKTGESTDVMVKMVNGKSRGLFILDVEPKEISIVLILGPVGMEELGKLKDIAFMAIMSGTHHTGPDNARKKDSKVKEKNKGGDQ
jgi:Domain of unknown function (DUF4252)